MYYSYGIVLLKIRTTVGGRINEVPGMTALDLRVNYTNVKIIFHKGSQT